MGSDRIESQGRLPFIEITAPETTVRVTQQLGRLIRTDEDPRHDDDPGRLVTKRWGGLPMRGLPDFEVIVEPTRRRAATDTRG